MRAGALLATAAILAACGGGGDSTSSTAEAENAADAEILNGILARQEGAVLAYEESLRGIGPPLLDTARRFLAQEQEHVDGTLRELMGLGEAAEAEAEEIPLPPMHSRAEYLTFLYELESGTIAAEIAAIGELSASGPRRTLAATVANQAQHLVWLRRGLGATPSETVPEAFENGTAPAPGAEEGEGDSTSAAAP